MPLSGPTSRRPGMSSYQSGTDRIYQLGKTGGSAGGVIGMDNSFFGRLGKQGLGQIQLFDRQIGIVLFDCQSD